MRRLSWNPGKLFGCGWTDGPVAGWNVGQWWPGWVGCGGIHTYLCQCVCVCFFGCGLLAIFFKTCVCVCVYDTPAMFILFKNPSMFWRFWPGRMRCASLARATWVDSIETSFAGKFHSSKLHMSCEDSEFLTESRVLSFSSKHAQLWIQFNTVLMFKNSSWFDYVYLITLKISLLLLQACLPILLNCCLILTFQFNPWKKKLVVTFCQHFVGASNFQKDPVQ